MANIRTAYNKVVSQQSSFETLLTSINELSARDQRLVSEVVFLRFFSVFEQAVCTSACRLVCGTVYGDGVSPNLIGPNARSTIHAENLMKTHGRNRGLNHLKWTKATFIAGNLVNLLDATDTFMTVIRVYGLQINEMRMVRNHIAHQTASTRSDFQSVIRLHYGAAAKISPGCFLLTGRHSPCKLIEYMATSEIILRTALRI